MLLVLFQVSHTLEHVLTKRAQGNLQNLFDRVPDEAILVELDAEGEPRISEARSLPAADISTGSNMLVRPGQQVGCCLGGRKLRGLAPYGFGSCSSFGMASLLTTAHKNTSTKAKPSSDSSPRRNFCRSETGRPFARPAASARAIGLIGRAHS